MTWTRRAALTACLAPSLGAGLPALTASLAACAEPTARLLRTRVVAAGLVHPWSVAFLPDFARDGRMLVTERPGRLRVVDRGGRVSAPIAGLPAVAAGGQGGLFDVLLHPAHARNRWVYWSYAEPAAEEPRRNGTAVARGRLDLAAMTLTDVQVIFRQQPKVESNAHFGGRLVFARDGTLFVTLGERYVRRDDAPRTDTDLGKVVRLREDGSIPPDNPFVGQPGARPELWSLGHRNVQGAALHPQTGELWTHEHGPQGGDELNVDLPGRQYGWPLITRGREYGSGAPIGEGETRADVEPAVVTWVPSIAPSGMAWVDGTRHPAWRGQLLVGALKAQQLVRLELDGRRLVRETRHAVGDRVRDVRLAPDGEIYLLTDAPEGRLLQVEPAA